MGLTQKLGTIPLAILTDSSNNVGIGAAANASFKLQVTGTSLFTDGTQGLNIRAYTGGAGFGAIYSSGVTAGAGNFALAASATQTILSGVDNVNLAINSAIKLAIASTGAATFAAASSGAITLTTNGSANNWTSAITGNSTTSQSYGLLIQAGTNSTDAALRVRNQANSLDWLFVRGDGQVGIGTISPTANLTIYNATVPYMNLKNASSGTYGTVFGFADSSGNAEIWNYDNGYLRFATNGTERMRIAAGGLVTVTGTGAGNTSEGIFFKRTSSLAQGGYISGNGGALQIIATNEQNGVNGTTIFGRFNGTTVTESMTITSGGNVLIGTTTDNGQKLQVNGGVSYSSGGLIQNLNDSVSANSTRTYTITGNLAGGIQIMVGAFGNGTGNSSRALFVGGGYLDSALPYTEVFRVNIGTIVISAITSNTSSSVFTVTNNFGFNSAFVGITIISGGLIGNPTITAS